MQERILVISAMENTELDYLKTKLKNSKKVLHRGITFYEGTLYEKEVILCTSGIGLIKASMALTIAIEFYNPMVIINEGLAGGYTKELKTGEIIVGEEAINITSLEYKGIRRNFWRLWNNNLHRKWAKQTNHTKSRQKYIRKNKTNIRTIQSTISEE